MSERNIDISEYLEQNFITEKQLRGFISKYTNLRTPGSIEESAEIVQFDLADKLEGFFRNGSDASKGMNLADDESKCLQKFVISTAVENNIPFSKESRSYLKSKLKRDIENNDNDVDLGRELEKIQKSYQRYKQEELEHSMSALAL